MAETKKFNSISAALVAFAAVIAACFAIAAIKAATPVAHANVSAQYATEEMTAAFDMCDAVSEIAELIGSALEEGEETDIADELEFAESAFSI